MKPPSNANIYSASAAAVIAGKSVPLSGSSGVGSGSGNGSGGGGSGGGGCGGDVVAGCLERAGEPVSSGSK